MLNLLQPVWQQHSHVKKALTDTRWKYRAARQCMELIDRIKSLGFRHDLHSQRDEFMRQISWMIENGMSSHLLSILSQLCELEIIDNASVVNVREFFVQQQQLSQAFENFFLFWSAACVRLYESAILTLEDQKYWALVELEKALQDGRFTTGAHRYHHILVDEFQDINALDLNLLKAIAKINKTELCILGDDDQAIYEWRGATPEFILKPETYLSPEYHTYTLEVNYRSPRNIVQLSQQLIQNNKRRVAKNVKAAQNLDACVEVISMPALQASVEHVRRFVKELIANENIKNIAIIGRKRSQIIPYQIVFAGDDIPFYAAEDLHVLLSEAFDDLKSMLLLKVQQADKPLPLGPDPIKALLKLCDKVKQYPLNKQDRASLRTYLANKNPRTLVQSLEALYHYQGPLKGENVSGEMSARFYEALKEFIEADTVAAAVRVISDNFKGLQKDYGKSIDDIFYADPPFSYLSDYAERYGNDYVAFYQDIEKAIATLARIPNTEEDEAWHNETWKCRLHLMTALRAKGKEFDVAIILDCNQGVWPSQLARTEEELEAERRLFYVAITRVRKHLLLITNQRMFGELATPSPYLKEMSLSTSLSS
jgi:DNA helicase-2/ATP-dependent DNA helicase PcrA